jgi:hypothetical protein
LFLFRVKRTFFESMLGDDVMSSEVVAPYIDDTLTLDEKIEAQVIDFLFSTKLQNIYVVSFVFFCFS